MKLFHFTNSELLEETSSNQRKALYCFNEKEIAYFSKYIKRGMNSFEEIKEAYQEDYEESFFDKAFFYGNFVHSMEIEDEARVLHVTENIDELREDESINKEFEKRAEVEDEDEVLENFYDTDLEILVNSYALSHGYDIVVWDDRTEGIAHKSYAIVNPKVIIR
jgi:hypothetical protein